MHHQTTTAELNSMLSTFRPIGREDFAPRFGILDTVGFSILATVLLLWL